MNIQKFNKEFMVEYIDDILRIRNILNAHGFDMLFMDIYELWSNHSNKISARWLNLPRNDDKLYEILINEIIT